jgi:hypothetical protein
MITRVHESVLPLEISGNLENDPATTTGLTWGYKAGSVAKSGVRTAITAGTVALGAGTNYVYVDISGTPTVTVSQSLPSQRNTIFLYVVGTSGADIVSIEDVRGWLTSSTIVV